MELLGFLIIVALASRYVIKDTRAALQKSRAASSSGQPGTGRRHARTFRHDLGFHANQVTHGFPVARHGFMRGWDQASKAHAEAMAGRQQARTDRLEHRAGLVPQLTDYRARQQAALTRIQASQTPDAAPAPEQPAGQEGRPSRRADGRPETPADTRFFDLRQSGYAGPIGRDGNIPDPSDPEAARDLAILNSLRRNDGDTSVVTENGEPVGADGQPIPAGERFGSISDPDAQRAMAQGGRIVPRQGSAFEGDPPRTSPSTPSPEGENAMPNQSAGEVTYDGVQRT